MASIFGRSAAIRRTVNACTTSLRSRVCTGGSLSSSMWPAGPGISGSAGRCSGGIVERKSFANRGSVKAARQSA